MATRTPDIFTNVHKGIRKALFDTSIALGRAGEDAERGAVARSMLRNTLRFVAFHGEVEDTLLLPPLQERAPAVYERIHAAHEDIDAALRSLNDQAETATTEDLFAGVNAFIANYLEHMRVEEQEIDPVIREVVTAEELASFGQRAAGRAAPEDQKMMLAWMLPAMTRADVDAFLSRFPAALADQLRPLAA